MREITPDQWVALVADPPDVAHLLPAPSRRGRSDYAYSRAKDIYEDVKTFLRHLLRTLPHIPQVLGVVPLTKRSRPTYAITSMLLRVDSDGRVSLTTVADPDCDWVGALPGDCHPAIAEVWEWLAGRARAFIDA